MMNDGNQQCFYVEPVIDERLICCYSSLASYAHKQIYILVDYLRGYEDMLCFRGELIPYEALQLLGLELLQDTVEVHIELKYGLDVLPLNATNKVSNGHQRLINMPHLMSINRVLTHYLHFQLQVFILVLFQAVHASQLQM